MKENLDFLFSQSPSVPLNEFVVARVKPFTDVKKPIPNDQIEIVYAGGNDESSLLLGFGIARQVATDSGNVLLIFNPEQDVVFPSNMDYGQRKMD